MVPPPFTFIKRNRSLYFSSSKWVAVGFFSKLIVFAFVFFPLPVYFQLAFAASFACHIFRQIDDDEVEEEQREEVPYELEVDLSTADLPYLRTPIFRVSNAQLSFLHLSGEEKERSWCYGTSIFMFGTQQHTDQSE